MKKIKLAVLLSAVFFAQAAVAQKKCDCSITPYKPDSCFYSCAGRILRNATDIDLQLVLGLDGELAKKILNVNKDSANASFKSFIATLNGPETEKLIRSLNGLSKQQNNYLIKPLEDKKKIMANLEKSLKARPS